VTAGSEDFVREAPTPSAVAPAEIHSVGEVGVIPPVGTTSRPAEAAKSSLRAPGDQSDPGNSLTKVEPHLRARSASVGVATPGRLASP